MLRFYLAWVAENFPSCNGFPGTLQGAGAPGAGQTDALTLPDRRTLTPPFPPAVSASQVCPEVLGEVSVIPDLTTYLTLAAQSVLRF